ncbi:hypothetical protein U1Q18_024323, partial [Sarracenia purpurea var. burkii]
PEKWMEKHRNAERRCLRMAVEAACEIFSYQEITDSSAGFAVRMGKNNLAASRTEISVPNSPPAATDRRRGSYTAPLPESLKLHVSHGQELASSQKNFQYPSIDSYLASLCRSVPAVFPEFGGGGGAASSKDSEEDPASNYLNLDVEDELSTDSIAAAAGGETNGMVGEGAMKG